MTKFDIVIPWQFLHELFYLKCAPMFIYNMSISHKNLHNTSPATLYENEKSNNKKTERVHKEKRRDDSTLRSSMVVTASLTSCAGLLLRALPIGVPLRRDPRRAATPPCLLPRSWAWLLEVCHLRNARRREERGMTHRCEPVQPSPRGACAQHASVARRAGEEERRREGRCDGEERGAAGSLADQLNGSHRGPLSEDLVGDSGSVAHLFPSPPASPPPPASSPSQPASGLVSIASLAK